MVSAGIVATNNYLEFMEKTLLEAFTAGLEGEQDWKKMWTEKKSTKRREEVVEYATPDVTIVTPEGAPYAELRMEKIRSKAVVHTDYTGMLRITHQFQRDNMYDQMEEDTWGLGEAVNRTLAEEGVRQFHEGFAAVQAPDGQPWFGTHTCALNTGQTWSNLYSGGLDADGLDAALVLFSKTKNENGKITPFGTGVTQLIVAPARRRIAKQLAMTGQYEPGKANFDINTFEVEPVIIPMLNMANSTYVDSQFYIRDKKRAKNLYLVREGPLFDTLMDPLTDDIIVKVRHASSFLIGSARGVLGSQG